jgi:hypothetical protein
MEVVQTNIGPEGKVDVSIEAGKILISLTHIHASGQVTIQVTEDLKYFLEILKPKLPAGFQFIIPVAEAALP